MFQNRTFLRHHVAGLFRAEGGLVGFTAWATDIAREIQPPEVEHVPEPVAVVSTSAPGDLNVADEPYEEPPRIAPRPVAPPPPPEPKPEVDLGALIDAKFANFERLLPTLVGDLVRQAMPPLRPTPMPVQGLTMPTGYDRSARPAFGLSPEWPYNPRR